MIANAEYLSISVLIRNVYRLIDFVTVATIVAMHRMSRDIAHVSIFFLQRSREYAHSLYLF